MPYVSGEEPLVGDEVALDFGHGPPGVVVVVIGESESAPGYRAENWQYLGRGLMVEVEGMGLVHYQGPESDHMVLVRRAAK